MSALSIVKDLTELAPTLEEDYHIDAEMLPVTMTLEEKVFVLAAVRDCRADLAAFAKRVEADVLAEAGEKRWVIEGLGEVAIRKSIRRSEWASEDLTRVLVARALDERELNVATGEYESAHEAVARVLMDCARPSWRVTPLRERGIQVDEFCTERDDGYSLQLPPRGM